MTQRFAFLKKEFHVLSKTVDGYLVLANISTFANFLCGVIITFALLLDTGLDTHWMVRILVFGASWDAIDGKFARRSQFENKFGKQLDTYADLVTFAIAPTLMIIDLLQAYSIIVALLSASMYLFAASFRLSRFMLGESSQAFNGMPSPVAAIFVAAFYMIDTIDSWMTAMSFVMIALVMMSNLEYTAMKTLTNTFDRIHFYFGIILMLLLTYSPVSWLDEISWTFIIYIYYFVIFGPAHANYQQSKIAEMT